MLGVPWRAATRVAKVATSTAGAVTQVGRVTGYSVAAAIGVGVGLSRAGVGLVAPAAVAPRRVAVAVGRGASTIFEGELSRELGSLLDPRRGRRHRRVASGVDRVHVEVRGLTGPTGAALAALLDHRFAGTEGVLWCQVNAVTGRVGVGLDSARRTVADVIEIIRAAELDSQTANVPWNRHVDLPGDREPVLAAGLAVAADVLAFAVALPALAIPTSAAVKALTAGLALIDAQPRLRRAVEGHLGASRTDLVIAVGNAAAQAVSHGAVMLLVDGGQRLAALAELRAARQSWHRWEQLLHGPDGISVGDPLLFDARPRPLPPGPVERFADQAAGGSLLAAAATMMGRQNLTGAADALLVGVPKAARASRESFASTLSVSLSRQGALCLDSSVWRRLDRVSAVVIDGAAVRNGPQLVLDARATDHCWTAQHVWSAGQRLLWQEGPGRNSIVPAQLPVPPPQGRQAQRLALADQDVFSRGRPDGTLEGPGSRWLELLEDGRVVGQVLVAGELHPRADSLLAAARRVGLWVVLVGEVPGSELLSRADELVDSTVSMTQTVRRLQAGGRTVAVVSDRAHRALAAADVGLGVAVRSRTGQLHIPWSADVVCQDLAIVEQIVSATQRARAVSERGRTLARVLQ